MASPKPLPRNLVLVRSGKNGKTTSRLRDNEPQPAVEVPPPPPYLGEAARHAFTMFATKLAALRVMTAADCEALALVANSFADWQDAVDKIAKFGPIMRTRTGYMTPSPYVSIKNRTWVQVMRGLAEFGLTPSSRRHVSTT